MSDPESQSHLIEKEIQDLVESSNHKYTSFNQKNNYSCCSFSNGQERGFLGSSQVLLLGSG